MLVWVRLLIRATGAVSVTARNVALVEAQEFIFGSHRRREFVERHLTDWCEGMVRRAGVRTEITPLPPPKVRGRVVVANHSSPVDIPILLGTFGGHVLSRADVVNWPVIGPAAVKAGTIFVNRRDRMSGASAIRAIRSHLQAGHTIILFPEGTTHRGDNVFPFAGGAFRAAAGLDVDFVPVGIAYPQGTEWDGGSLLKHLTGLAGRRRVDVAVRIGEPVVPSSLERPADLAERTRQIVQALTIEARKSLERRGIK